MDLGLLAEEEESEDDGMCGGSRNKPCKDCADRYCPREKGENNVMVRRLIFVVIIIVMMLL